MSRLSVPSITASVLLVIPSIALAGFSLHEWKYFKTFSGDNPPQYIRVVVDRETFNHARSDMGDLRIADSAGVEVPYQLIRGEEWRSVEQCNARVLNVSHAPGKYSVVVLDLGESGRTHTTVDLDIDSRNYRRNAEVWGSDDYRHWFVLRTDAAVFDFSTSDDSVRVTRIRYPSSIFRYVKVHVINGTEPPLAIRSARVEAESEPARTLRTYDVAAVSVEEDKDRKATTLLIDGTYANVPLTGITLETGKRNFYRTVQIYAGNDTARMTYVGNDVIYRYDTPRFSDERLSVTCRPTPARYLRLVIQNQDDRPVPIEVKHLIALEYSLVVRASSSGLRLFFGNPSAPAPHYDISRTLRYIDLQTAHPASLGELTANPDYAPRDERPWTERHPVLLWIMFGVVFVVLGYLVVHMVHTGEPNRPAS
jgi:hypothetical protein